MPLLRKSIALLLCLMLPAVSVGAQSSHAADESDLYRLMRAQTDREQGERELLRRVLKRAEVRETAQRFGLDVARAESAVATLDGAELDRLASHARQVEDSLNGGATVVITTTTIIIIILLLVIFIIVATD